VILKLRETSRWRYYREKKDLFVLKKRWSSQLQVKLEIEAMVLRNQLLMRNCRCERNFNVSGGSQATQDAIQDFTFKAFETLDKMNLDTTKKEVELLRKLNGSTGAISTLIIYLKYSLQCLFQKYRFCCLEAVSESLYLKLIAQINKDFNLANEGIFL
jgi:hypothetical protein